MSRKRKNDSPAEPVDEGQCAESILLDVVRQAPRLHFTMPQAFHFAEHRRLWPRFGLSKEQKRDLHPLFAEAAERLNAKLRYLRVEVDRRGEYDSAITAQLLGGAEWTEAAGEAWSFNATRNEFNLTDPGQALLEYIRSGDLEPGFVSERSISYRLGFNGRLDCIEPYLREVADKAAIGMRWEVEGKNYGERRMYRLWLENSEATSMDAPRGLNPCIDVDFEKFTRDDLEAARATIYRALLATSLTGSELVHIVSISTRRELLHCFPRFESRSWSPAEFFSSLSLNPATVLGYDFRPDVAIWKVAIRPKPDWPSALKAIDEELSRPTLQERFALSDEAARLLSWIESLPEEKKLIGKLTPIIEDAVEKWIGIKCPWPQDNFPVYLQILIDEINERTDYDLLLQPWREYSSVRSRIRIRQKHAEIDGVLLQLQRLCRVEGITFDRTKADSMLCDLLTRREGEEVPGGSI